MTVNPSKIKPLTEKQRKILQYVSAHQEQKGYAPSLEEIAEKFGLRAHSTVHKHLKLIKKKGYLKRAPNESRGIYNVIENDAVSQIPLLGRIPAGRPIEPIENPEPLDVPTSMLKGHGDYYALEVSGDSMIDENIISGDIILILNKARPELGEVIVAVTDGEATLKKFGGVFGDKIKLIPRNTNYDPFFVDALSFECRGKYVGLLRRN